MGVASGPRGMPGGGIACRPVRQAGAAWGTSSARLPGANPLEPGARWTTWAKLGIQAAPLSVVHLAPGHSGLAPGGSGWGGVL